jgi:hypothetical protein
MPRATIIGIHPLDAGEELFDQAVTDRYGLISLSPDRQTRESAFEVVRRDLASVVLVEMIIRDRDRRMYMGDFGQSRGDVLGAGDEVACFEVFLSADGTERLADYLDEVPGPDVRVAFFLHDFKPSRPILTSYGPVDPSVLTPMPARLRRLAAYKPR